MIKYLGVKKLNYLPSTVGKHLSFVILLPWDQVGLFLFK